MKVEKWSSSEGRTEVHYFRDDDEYLFGYNPLLLPPELLEELITWSTSSTMPLQGPTEPVGAFK